jgi:hypothetical protein
MINFQDSYGISISGSSVKDVAAKLVETRRARGLGGANYGQAYRDVLDDVRTRRGAGEPSAGRITLSDAMAAAKAAINLAIDAIVPQSEINRRAKICASCPRLVNISGCQGG